MQRRLRGSFAKKSSRTEQQIQRKERKNDWEKNCLSLLSTEPERSVILFQLLFRPVLKYITVQSSTRC